MDRFIPFIVVRDGTRDGKQHYLGAFGLLQRFQEMSSHPSQPALTRWWNTLYGDRHVVWFAELLRDTKNEIRHLLPGDPNGWESQTTHLSISNAVDRGIHEWWDGYPAQGAAIIRQAMESIIKVRLIVMDPDYVANNRYRQTSFRNKIRHCRKRSSVPKSWTEDSENLMVEVNRKLSNIAHASVDTRFWHSVPDDYHKSFVLKDGPIFNSMWLAPSLLLMQMVVRMWLESAYELATMSSHEVRLNNLYERWVPFVQTLLDRIDEEEKITDIRWIRPDLVWIPRDG